MFVRKLWGARIAEFPNRFEFNGVVAELRYATAQYEDGTAANDAINTTYDGGINAIEIEMEDASDRIGNCISAVSGQTAVGTMTSLKIGNVVYKVGS